MIVRPQSDEYAPFYAGYVQRVSGDTDLIALLERQPDDLRMLLRPLTDEQANSRPAPGEWSIKEVLGHIGDSERVFAYRTLRIARGDQTPLPGFDQNDYVSATDFNARPLGDILEEFTLQRRANMLLIKALTAAEIDRRGTASDMPVSVRALLHIIAGHVEHHLESLRTDYQLSG